MLQIITGKFFKSDDRHVSDGKGVLYSNYRWHFPLKSCVGPLEPISTHASLTTYLFSFKNQIEKQGGKVSVVRVGDGEIIEQFRLLCSFALRAIFAEDRSWVAHLCRSGTIGQSEKYAPSQLLPAYFAARIEGRIEDEQMFTALVDKVLSLNRSDYVSIMSALQAFSGALEVVGPSLDLSYSMLVYALESLAQNYTKYEPQWSDFDARTRTRLDPILATISPDKAESVRNALLSHAHLKLRARFQEFICEHVDDGFFASEAAGRSRPLQKSELRRVARNAYDVRSAYVHELTSLLHQLRVPPIARDDTFHWEDEPHLTFNGLVRLTDHVIRNLIRRLLPVEKEEFDWYSSLPGVIKLKAAPQYWIHQAAGFSPATAHDYFAGFLSRLIEVIASGEPICDMSGVMAKIEELDRAGKPGQRKSILALYLVYNASLLPELRRPKWQSYLERHRDILDQPSIQMMAAHVVVNRSIPWTSEIGEIELKLHDETRFHRNVFHLPRSVEIAVTVAVANQALREGFGERHRLLLRTALLNCAGLREIQAALEDAVQNAREVDIEIILPRKPREAGQPAVSQ